MKIKDLFKFRFNPIKIKKPYIDSDRDGVMNWFDCAPLDPRRQEIYQWQDAKRRVINKKHLFHKTELSAANQILKSGKLKAFHTGKFHMSEYYNPRVVYKNYKEPVVLVLEKKKIPTLQKIDYGKKGEYQDIKFEAEKEWVTPGSPVTGVLKGIILNENIKTIKLKSSEAGINRTETGSFPTRYVTEEDMYKIKFERR